MNLRLVLVVALGLSAGAYLLGAAETPTEDAKIAEARENYRLWLETEKMLQTRRKEISAQEQLLAAKEAELKNYQTVKARNAELLAKLEKWAAEKSAP